ncbi:MAG: hypothetical protein J3Q66DRAFT_117188 [Benniella sp.]|nr:MAG: hypothetical protein J3Q66DRAFT_117188 [Benniella sp.]
MKFLNSSILLFSAAAVLVQAKSVVLSSKAIFTGVNKYNATASGFDIFRYARNHPTAIASILDKFSKESGFQPKKNGLYKTDNQFNAFKEDVKNFKYINYLGSHTIRFRPWGSPEDIRKDIIGRYSPIKSLGWDLPPKSVVVASALVDQIPATADKALAGNWTVALVALHGYDDNRIRVDITQVDFQLRVLEDGGADIAGDEAFLHEDSYDILTGGLFADAQAFATAYPKVTVNTLLDNLTTA